MTAGQSKFSPGSFIQVGGGVSSMAEKGFEIFQEYYIRAGCPNSNSIQKP